MSTLKVGGIRGISASSDAISVANDGTCTANITNNLSNRNILINGAMQIAQRKTSHTSGNGGYHTVDRYKYVHNGNDNDLTQAQADVAAGTTPYTLGFRKSYKLTNGNQTGVLVLVIDVDYKLILKHRILQTVVGIINLVQVL